MASMEELDVLWPETCHTHEPLAQPPPPSSSPVPVQAAQASDAPTARSRPVDVPGRPKAARSWRWNGHGPRDDSVDHDDDNGGGNGSAIVPPHLLLLAGWRSEDAEPGWTLWASVGPPCKCKRARDLRRLRDSVLRVTGFIEG